MRLIWLVFLCSPFLVTTPLAARIRVTVAGIHSRTGNIMVGLFSRDGYPDTDKMLSGKMVPAAPEITVDLDGFPTGEYAISIYHDENGNGELDKNFLGVPLEGYGFSHNLKAILGPPPFEKTSFFFTGNDMNFVIGMVY